MEPLHDTAAYADLLTELCQMKERRQKMLLAANERLKASNQLIQSSKALLEHS